jgi:hypothetical protein
MAAVKRIELRSPLARAVVPVLAGIGFFVVLFGVLWVFAVLISDNEEAVTNLTPDRFEVGPVTAIAESIADDGPILFPGLGPDSGDRTLVLSHDGNDPQTGWVVYFAHPADRDLDCPVDQVEGTDRFTDCDGRELTVEQLAPPPGIFPVVIGRQTLYIDLQQAVRAG